MGIRSQKLSDFFNIGLDLGWDVEKQKWTVNQLISPEGISWTLSDVIDGGFPLETPLIKSGNRFPRPRREDRPGNRRLSRFLSLVLEDTIHEHFLDPLGMKVEGRAIHEHEIGILAHLDAADPLVEHHGLGAVDGQSLERVLLGEPVTDMERAILAEALRPLRALVSLNARQGPRLHQLLDHVVGRRGRRTFER